MKNFDIEFDFEGRHQVAAVTEIGGLDDTQYIVSPKEEALGERFKSNTIRKLNDDPASQYTIPEVEGGDDYMQAICKGLDEYLATVKG